MPVTRYLPVACRARPATRTATNLFRNQVNRHASSRARRTSRISYILRDEAYASYSHGLPPWSILRNVLAEKIAKSTPIIPNANAALVLASKEYARLIEDHGLMSQLLKSLFLDPSGTTSGGHDISVAFGVVDGVIAAQPSQKSRSGLTILSGNLDDILPGLWNHSDKVLPNSRQREEPSSLCFSICPLPGSGTRPVNATLPLANTVFQNGQTSTLLASRWRRDESGSFTMSLAANINSQLVVPGHSASRSALAIPLLPVTPPRKIVSGLGNIIRQVEIDGKSAPGSKELEVNINHFVQQQEKAIAGPVKVWAWIIDSRSLGEPYSPKSKSSSLLIGESPTALISTEQSMLYCKEFPSGARLHRVLSGGGGWGLKQGLLSLDPQTQYGTESDEDVESFIRSFSHEDVDAPGSIVVPGSYVQFFISPASLDHSQELGALEQLLKSRDRPSMVLGTIATEDSEPSTRDLGEKNSILTIEQVNDHFGAASSTGLFVELASQGDSTSDGNMTNYRYRSKIDAPGSFIWQ